MKRIVVLIFLIFSLAVQDTSAQCAMCRRAVETGHSAKDSKVGGGLNAGVLYLLAIPYLLGGIGLAVWYKKTRK